MTLEDNRVKENFRRWLEGIPYEIAFWKSYYSDRRRLADLVGWSQYDSEIELDGLDFKDFFQQRSRAAAQAPKVLDVGCGLSYAFGNIVDGKKIDVQYIDTLAPFYNEILAHSPIERPRIKFGMMENLTAGCYDEPADFIHIRNALDHCFNPIEGIRQALACLKIGGVLYLNHFENEAENEAYRGFHQFNITEKDGRMIVWNKDNKLNVNDIFGPYASVEVSRTNSNRIVAVLTKTQQFPDIEKLLCQTCSRVGQMTIDTVEYFHRPSKSFKYQWQSLYCKIGHSIARKIPYGTLHRLKKLVGKKPRN